MKQDSRIIPILQADQISRQQAPSAPVWGVAAPPPLTLYIHVPWCIKKCPYCDFNSHEVPDQLPEAEYLEALTADLEAALPNVWGRQIQAVFFGGGTPSLLSEATLDAILMMVRSRLPLCILPEITLEANPGTAEANRFKGYAASGVSRISLGVQALDDAQLLALGRIHDASQARHAIDLACQTFERVNLDLMYGLPEQTLSQWRQALQEIRGYATGHLSLYQLTIEPQTVFAKYPPKQPDDDTLADMEDAITDEIVSHGWDRYEISAYAKHGQQCQHNMNYWRFGDYLGIGPGAHSKLSFQDRIIRQARTRNPQQWMQNALRRDDSHITHDATIERQDMPFEFMLNALRLKEGVPSDLFESYTGMPLREISAPLNRAMDEGLLSEDPTRIVATELGWRHLTTLQSIFLPENL